MALESQLLNRVLGQLSPRGFQDWLLRNEIDSLTPAPDIMFDGSSRRDATADSVWAHRSGANAIAVDNIEGSLLITGGADAGIHLWSLENSHAESAANLVHTPLLTAPHGRNAHTHGITCLTFYPFDSEAVLSSSYDHSLKISSTHTLAPTASFSLGSIINAHAMSPIAQHVLVACATQSSIVRLVDLRSGAMAQGLIGHHGEVLNVSWSPKREHILASTGADGTVRLWDVRRSAAAIGMLDLENEVDITTRGGESMQGRAHVGACNAVAWTPDGQHIVTAGLDERIRVWDAATGRNTLVHFGPSIRNKKMATVSPALINQDGRDILLWPNEKEIIVGELLQGRIIRKLRPRGAVIAQGGAGTRIVKERVNSLVWRGAGNMQLYSAHADGLIRAWLPARDLEKEAVDETPIEDNENVRKRKALEEIHRSLSRQKITFN